MFYCIVSIDEITLFSPVSGLDAVLRRRGVIIALVLVRASSHCSVL